MLDKSQRFLGGGKLYFERLKNGELQAKQEIGEVKDFKVSVAKETAIVDGEDCSTTVDVDEVVIKESYSISFTTNQVDKDSLLLALGGDDVTTKTFAAGETLPDGTIAQNDTTYNVVDPKSDFVEGRLTFATCAKVGKNKVAVFHKVKLKLDSELILSSKEKVSIPMTGTVLADTSVSEGSRYFRVYEEQ